MIETRFTKLVGCSVPIQQSGMGAAAPPELAAAVSEAGALGMLGTARPGVTVDTLGVLLSRTRGLTARPFGVNFIVAPSFRKRLDLRLIEMAASVARVVEFFYGEPERLLVDMVHAAGALACWQVGTSREAVAAVEAGCDFVIVQGVEAGGHVRGTIGTLALLGEVVGAIGVPVLAAGGIGTGRAIAAALAAGADGVRMGTRFLGAVEAGIHPQYLAALISARAQDTVYTSAFSLGWRDAPHRVLRSCVDAAQAFEGDLVGEWANVDGTRLPSRRFDVTMATNTTTGFIAAMPFYAGESVGAVTRLQSAAEIVRELIDQAEATGR